MYFGSGGSDPMRSHDIPRYPINIAPDPMKSHPIPVLTISTLSQLTQIAQPFLASLWITFSQHSKKE